MKIPAHAHIAVADGEHFTLFRNEGTDQEPVLRPVSVVLGSDSAHHAGQGDSPRQNEEAGHAAAISNALNAAVLSHKIKHLVVVADPATLGEMRKYYHKELEAVLIGEMAKTLTGHSGDDVLKSVAAA